MIHNIVPVLANELNEYLRSEYRLTEDCVVVSSILDAKGNLSPQIENKVVVSLYHLEEEKALRSQQSMSSAGINPPLCINLYVLFAAHFPDPNYLESLKYLSSILMFFQGKSAFDQQNTPLLSTNVDKLTIELVNLDVKELGTIWATIGTPYMPSVMYKVRMLRFSGQMVKEDIPSIAKRVGGNRLGKIIRNLGALSTMKQQIDAAKEEESE